MLETKMLFCGGYFPIKKESKNATLKALLAK